MALKLYHQYNRETVAHALGARFSPYWNQGVVVHERHLILFVTLDKGRHRPEHRYDDRFLTPNRFAWQSRRTDTRDGEYGQKYARHAERGLGVHLLVRPTQLLEGRGREFTYFGQVDHVDSRNDEPIDVTWRLRQPAPRILWLEFGIWEPAAPGAAEGDQGVEGDDPQAADEVRAAVAAFNYHAPDAWGMRKLRAGYRVFRREVLRNFEGACCICGIAEEALLDAAHIIPWSVAPEHRLNPANGLALCALHHRAYDRGLMDILPDGSIAASPRTLTSAYGFAKAALADYHGAKIRRPTFGLMGIHVG